MSEKTDKINLTSSDANTQNDIQAKLDACFVALATPLPQLFSVAKVIPKTFWGMNVEGLVSVIGNAGTIQHAQWLATQRLNYGMFKEDLAEKNGASSAQLIDAMILRAKSLARSKKANTKKDEVL